ncbi:acyltransferase [Aquitalea sp. S1-19]|nr:acyltransferase [Aquitalea sp. S1-19]
MKSLLAFCCRPWLGALLGWGIRGKRLSAWLGLAARIPLPSSCVVMGSVELHGTKAIQIGERCLFYPGLYLETQQEGGVQIGDDVVCSRGVHLAAYAGIRIGAGSMLGEYVSVRDANHCRQAGMSLREAGHRAAPIDIGQQVWVGRGAIILSGVRIGDRATIAANAVVNQDVPADGMVGGVPARPLSRVKRGMHE